MKNKASLIYVVPIGLRDLVRTHKNMNMVVPKLYYYVCPMPCSPLMSRCLETESLTFMYIVSATSVPIMLYLVENGCILSHAVA